MPFFSLSVGLFQVKEGLKWRIPRRFQMHKIISDSCLVLIVCVPLERIPPLLTNIAALADNSGSLLKPSKLAFLLPGRDENE